MANLTSELDKVCFGASKNELADVQKHDEVFFSDKGLTSTSANHLANIAQEWIVSSEAVLRNINFVTTTIDIVGSPADSGKIISKGYDEEKLFAVRGLLEEIAQMNAFCAWMREAVKAKDAELKAVADMEFDKWMEINSIELTQPKAEKEITADDIIAQMNVKERNEYFYLEAVSATIGKCIHPNGAFSTARANLNDKINKPYSTNGLGKETLIYAYTPSVNAEKVENVFFELQKWYRSNEQRLNQIKYDIKRKAMAANLERNQKFKEANAEYKIKFKEYFAQFNEWKIKETERISQLKIVVPQALEKIFEKLSESGK
jgi:hypothetical protein